MELSKVTWPTNKQLAQYTLVVIVIALFVAVFLGAIDFGLQWILDNFILN